MCIRDSTNGQELERLAVAIQDRPLAPGESHETTLTFTLPNGLAGTGNIRATVYADSNAVGLGTMKEAREGITPSQAEANNSQFLEFAATERTYANLIAEITAVPNVLVGGQSGNLSWRVSNNSTVPTDATAWTDKVYLSVDGTLDDSDILLSTSPHSGILAEGAEYALSLIHI